MDLVTANVAVAYFTVHHPRLVDSESPWVMAFVWGMAASWWAGAIGGIILALVNTRLRLPPKRVLRMVAISCAVLWALMMVVLVSVYALGGLVPVESRSADFESDRRLMAVAVAHMSEYVLAALATGVVAFRMVVVSRRDSALLS
jgi:hypothetical protein